MPQIKLHPKYAPLIRRGQRLENQASPESFAERRAASETNIDLWTDGRLYTVDPATRTPPSFRTTKQYMEYLCEGENGMLGYTKRLRSGSVSIDRTIGQHSGEQMADCVSRLQSEVSSHERCILQLRAQCDELHVQMSSMSDAEARHREERLQLEADVKALEITCAGLRVLVAHNDVTRAESDQRQERIGALEVELIRCREAYEKLQEKMKKMVETPLGFRERVHSRKMKSLDELAPGSGHAKRRRTALRWQIQPSTVQRVQKLNRRQGKKKRLGVKDHRTTRQLRS